MITSSSSFIHPDARIGANVSIEPFAVIHADVVIGDNTWIGSGATICDGARIGKNCKIFQGAVVSNIPQDLKYHGEKTITEIGDNTIIREFVTVHKGTDALGKTVIGSDCLLMAYTHIAHDCILGNHVILANSVNLAGHVEINDWAIIEGDAGISQFVRIGAHSFIAGKSGVRKDVPPFIKAAREPLTFAGVNSVGLRRRGYESESVHQIQDMYRYIYQKGNTLQYALGLIETEFPQSEHRDLLLSFIRSSQKGIIRGSNEIEQEDDD